MEKIYLFYAFLTVPYDFEYIQYIHDLIMINMII